MKTGVTVHRATAGFTVNGKAYPAGSIVVKAAQAFRPHVLDMFEPQDHPHDLAYPGGPPIPPYDSAGWTLAYQMGIEFDRILDAFDGPFERLTAFIEPKATVAPLDAPAGYLLSAAENDAARTVNRLLAAGARVSRLSAAPGRRRHLVRRGIGGRARADPRGRGAGRDGHAGRGQAGRRQRAGRPGAHRPGRRVRRLDPVRLDPLAARAVPSSRSRSCSRRCSTPASLNARYDVLIVADDLVPEPGRRSRASVRRCGDGAGAVPVADGPHHGGADGPGAEGVPRRRRHHRRHRPVDGAGRAPAPADHERAGDADADRGPAAEAGGVLHPRLGAPGARGSEPAARLGNAGAGRRLLRQQPGVPPRAGRRVARA